jgi:hypothetical protein
VHPSGAGHRRCVRAEPFGDVELDLAELFEDAET